MRPILNLKTKEGTKQFRIIAEEIATLVNEKKQEGHHKIEFNRRNLPGGIYFYRIYAGDFVETKKFVLR